MILSMHNIKKINFDDGSFEYKFLGAHNDVKKTKELQDQGKKINLSLSEMAQFFMKLAEAFMKKKLAPGATIPGCNSFFLCKYLKDTMLQSRTYLFCAIRPEVEFLKYTFATLGFAKNASVVKLAPKKATVAASPGERKLMQELEAMKALVAQLQAAQGSGGGAPNADAIRMIADLNAKLMEKQSDLAKQLGGDSAGTDDSEKVERQRAEYSKRGIALAAYEMENNSHPYFINLDDDPFRSHRFMYILTESVTVFGSKGDIQPASLSVVKDHCKVMADAAQITIIAGKGETWINGVPIKAGEEKKLNVFDRVVMGDQLMLLHWPGHEDGAGSPMDSESAVEEFQAGLMSFRAGGAGGGSAELDEERKKLAEERARWEKEKTEGGGKSSGKVGAGDDKAYQLAMSQVDNAILDLLPKIKECKQTVDLLNRVTMTFDVVLEKGQDHVPKVKVSVENTSPKHAILIDPQEFLSKSSLLKDEMMKLRGAIDGGKEYMLPERHDPLYLMFDNDFLLGSSTQFLEYLAYNLETDDEEKNQDIKNSAVPYNNVGLLEVKWTPLGGPNEEDEGKAVPDIEDEASLLGKPWTYKVHIKRATGLPIFCEMAYVSYDFFGETFVTEAVQGETYSPVFDYSKVHHIPQVTQEFLDYLKVTPVEMQIHVTQHVETPPDKIGTSNAIVVDSIKTGEPKGYEVIGAAKPKSDAEIKVEKLSVELNKCQEENVRLKKKVDELEAKLFKYEGKKRDSIADAKLMDGIINGAGDDDDDIFNI